MPVVALVRPDIRPPPGWVLRGQDDVRGGKARRRAIRARSCEGSCLPDPSTDFCTGFTHAPRLPVYIGNGEGPTVLADPLCLQAQGATDH